MPASSTSTTTRCRASATSKATPARPSSALIQLGASCSPAAATRASPRGRPRRRRLRTDGPHARAAAPCGARPMLSARPISPPRTASIARCSRAGRATPELLATACRAARDRARPSRRGDARRSTAMPASLSRPSCPLALVEPYARPHGRPGYDPFSRQSGARAVAAAVDHLAGARDGWLRLLRGLATTAPASQRSRSASARA